MLTKHDINFYNIISLLSRIIHMYTFGFYFTFKYHFIIIYLYKIVVKKIAHLLFNKSTKQLKLKK